MVFLYKYNFYMSSHRISFTSQGKGQKIEDLHTDFGNQRGECQRDQNQEDRQFWEGMNECKRYLKEIQAQIGYIWQAPEKTQNLEIQQQQQRPYFMSQVSLKQKLTSIKGQKQPNPIQRKRIISNLLNKSGRRSQSSTISTKVIDKCQQRLSELKKIKQNRLQGRYGKTLSLVKLKTHEMQSGNEQQHFIKQLPIANKHQQKKTSVKKPSQLRLLQKHSPTIPDNGTFPMLTQLSYNISEGKVNKDSIKGIFFKKSEQQCKHKGIAQVQVQWPNQTIAKNKFKLKMEKQHIKIKCDHRKLKLKINDYVPEIKSQITVRDWEVFNRTVGLIKMEEVKSNECHLLRKLNQNCPVSSYKTNML